MNYVRDKNVVQWRTIGALRVPPVREMSLEFKEGNIPLCKIPLKTLDNVNGL